MEQANRDGRGRRLVQVRVPMHLRVCTTVRTKLGRPEAQSTATEEWKAVQCWVRFPILVKLQRQTVLPPPRSVTHLKHENPPPRDSRGAPDWGPPPIMPHLLFPDGILSCRGVPLSAICDSLAQMGAGGPSTLRPFDSPVPRRRPHLMEEAECQRHWTGTAFPLAGGQARAS